MILTQIHVYILKEVIGFFKSAEQLQIFYGSKSFMAPVPTQGSEHFMATSDCNVLPNLVSHLSLKLDIIQFNFIRWY